MAANGQKNFFDTIDLDGFTSSMIILWTLITMYSSEEDTEESEETIDNAIVEQ